MIPATLLAGYGPGATHIGASSDRVNYRLCDRSTYTGRWPGDDCHPGVFYRLLLPGPACGLDNSAAGMDGVSVSQHTKGIWYASKKIADCAGGVTIASSRCGYGRGRAVVQGPACAGFWGEPDR